MFTHKYVLHSQPQSAASHANGNKQHGLTMIELLVVLGILGIFIAIGAPSFSRFIADWRLSNAVNAFNGGLRIARAEAIAQRKIVTICPTNGGANCVAGADYANGWIIFTGAQAAPNTLVQQATMQGLTSISSAANNANNANNANIEFLPTGIMRNAPQATVTFQSSAYVDDASTAWAQKKIVVSRTGRVRKY